MTPDELSAYRDKSAVPRKNFSAIKYPQRRCAKCKLSKPVKGFRQGICADCQPKEADE